MVTIWKCELPKFATVCIALVVDCHSCGSGFLQYLIPVAEKIAHPPARPRMLSSPLIHVRCGGTGCDQKHFSCRGFRDLWHVFWTSLVAEVSARHKIWIFSCWNSFSKVSFLFATLVGFATTTLSKHVFFLDGPGWSASPNRMACPKRGEF